MLEEGKEKRANSVREALVYLRKQDFLKELCLFLEKSLFKKKWRLSSAHIYLPRCVIGVIVLECEFYKISK